MINIPLGMNVKDNPIVVSQYVQPQNELSGMVPPAAEGILTEGGTFILTEGADFILTE